MRRYEGKGDILYVEIPQIPKNIVIYRKPVIRNKRAPSGKAYIEIARRILGENIEVTIPGKETGLWAKIKIWFSKK